VLKNIYKKEVATPDRLQPLHLYIVIISLALIFVK